LRQLYKEKVLKNKSTYTNDIYDDKEVDLCFIRFDRDRDGKVSYDDVINETCEFYF
jgi:Ca2+-binding EF-hand superfamily protein